eukprot:835824-Rhodomonas_salina.2
MASMLRCSCAHCWAAGCRLRRIVASCIRMYSDCRTMLQSPASQRRGCLRVCAFTARVDVYLPCEPLPLKRERQFAPRFGVGVVCIGRVFICRKCAHDVVALGRGAHTGKLAHKVSGTRDCHCARWIRDENIVARDKGARACSHVGNIGDRDALLNAILIAFEL